ncbi:MAG TPA: isoprenylcysteine carboxylmethyltransferase family protein [Terriglobales bacterium]
MSTASNAIKTGVFTLFVPAIVGIGIPQSMVTGEPARGSGPAILRFAGGLLFVLGVFGYFWCAALFVRAQGTPAPTFPTQSTVVSGPYRVNRNPMYSSVLAVVFGQVLFYQLWRIAEYGAALAVCFHLFVVLYEKRALGARFDGEYLEFCRQVPRWISGLTSEACHE